MEFPHVLQVQSCRSQRRNGGVSGYEMAALAHRVNHHHRRIEAMGVGKFRDEVDTYHIPTIFGDGKGVQFAERLALLRLRAQAQIASLAVLTDKARHVWPPVVA